MQCVERQCCDGAEGLDEFEEKIDAIDSTRDGSHPWLEDVLHQLRRAKQEAEAGARQGEAAAAGDQGVALQHNTGNTRYIYTLYP